MKRLLGILFIALAFVLDISAAADSLYVKASEAYSAGDYEQAFTQYQAILDSGLESSELYFNLGNTAFRSNKLGYSILYYEKALKLDPGFSEAAQNLKYVSLYCEDKLDEVPVFFLKKWYSSLTALLSEQGWAILSVVLFVFLLSGVLVYIFANSISMKKAGFFIALLTVFLFFITITAAFNKHNSIISPDLGVVIAPSVVVKSSPSTSGTDLFVLHEGTRLHVDEQVGEWIEIRISDGRIGWLSRKSVSLI